MKKIITILLAIFFFSLFSQLVFCEDTKLPDLIPYRKGDKWGFCDKNKKIVIPCKYDEAYPFNGKFARVTLYAKKHLNDGLINMEGKEITPIKYDRIFSCGKDLFVLKELIKNEELYSIANLSGKEVQIIGPLKYKFYYEYPYFRNGLEAVTFNGKFGFINKSGTAVIPPQYDDVKSFYKGIAAVMLNGKWGCIDNSGKIIVPIKYDSVSHNEETLNGLIRVIVNDTFGLVNKKGQIVAPVKFIGWGRGYANFENGIMLLGWKDKQGNIRQGYIDIKGLKYWDD